jgi:hypothetical protein
LDAVKIVVAVNETVVIAQLKHLQNKNFHTNHTILKVDEYLGLLFS